MTNKLQEMSEDVQNRVREVAYLMWESAGRHQGMALEYWLAAEREVLATMQRAAERLMPLNMVNKVVAAEGKKAKPAAEKPASAPAAAEAPATVAQAVEAGAPAAEASSRVKKAPARSKTKT